MIFETILLIVLLAAIIISIIGVLIKKWDWLPIFLLIILWYVPRQAVPGGLLENYVVIRWLTVLLIPLVIIIQFLRLVMKSSEIRTTFIIWPLFAYICFNIISGIINNVQVLEFIGATTLYIRYPLLFIALANMDISKKTMSNFIKIFIFLVAIQIPECFYRFLALGIHGDFLSFTLGPWGQFDLGVYSIYVSCLIVAIGTIKGFKWYYPLFIVLLIGLALIGEIKALAISIPFVSLFVIYVGLSQQKIRKLILMIAIPVVFVAAIYISFITWERVHTESGNTLALYLEKMISFIRDPTQLFTVEKTDISSARFLGSAFVWNILKADWKMIFIGMGPGSMLAGNFLGTPGRIFEEIPYLNQIAVILGEVGLIGLIIYYWMLLRLLKYIMQVNKIIKDNDVHIIAVALFGMWLFYAVLGPFYDLVWRHDSPNFIFYFFTAFLYSYYLKEKESKPATINTRYKNYDEKLL